MNRHEKRRSNAVLKGKGDRAISEQHQTDRKEGIAHLQMRRMKLVIDTAEDGTVTASQDRMAPGLSVSAKNYRQLLRAWEAALACYVPLSIEEQDAFRTLRAEGAEVVKMKGFDAGFKATWGEGIESLVAYGTGYADLLFDWHTQLTPSYKAWRDLRDAGFQVHNGKQEGDAESKMLAIQGDGKAEGQAFVGDSYEDLWEQAEKFKATMQALHDAQDKAENSALDDLLEHTDGADAADLPSLEALEAAAEADEAQLQTWKGLTDEQLRAAAACKERTTELTRRRSLRNRLAKQVGQ